MNIPATEIRAFTLSLNREFNSPRDKVFQAWTDPAALKQWFGPKEVTIDEVRVDLKVGGRYQFNMTEPDGTTFVHGGQYRQIDPPRKLVFTWILDGQHCEGSQGEYAETLVTIDFQDLGASTRVVLTHEFLPSKASKEAHAMGWRSTFDSLEEALGSAV